MNNKIQKNKHLSPKLKKKESINNLQHNDNILSGEIDSIIDELPTKQKRDKLRNLLSVRVLQQSSFKGPLPPPNLLKGYDEIVKNGAERIFKLAEKQSKHRITLEDHAIKEELTQSSRGQTFGFILGIVGLLLATLLAILDHETIAGIFGTTTIVGLVTVFVVGRRIQQKDLDDK